MSKENSPVVQGLALIIGWTLITPLFDDIQDTIGNSFLYHPVALWLCIVALVYSQNGDFFAGVIVVIIYESFKGLWKLVKPEPPYIGQLRKLIHRMKNEGLQLSDNDIAFLNSITPTNVNVRRVT
jgi:hypothetical protein